MSQRPGITYRPFASTTVPCGRAVFADGSTLAMRLPSRTMVVPRRSAPVDTSMTVAFVIVRLWASSREPASARRRTSRGSAEGMVSECHVADDPPVPIGLAFPDGHVAPAAANGRRSLTFGLQVEPPAPPLGDTRWREHREAVLHDTASADRAELWESRLVHARHGVPAAGHRAVAGDEQSVVRVRRRDGFRVVLPETGEPGGVRCLDLRPRARQDRGRVETHASAIAGGS